MGQGDRVPVGLDAHHRAQSLISGGVPSGPAAKIQRTTRRMRRDEGDELGRRDPGVPARPSESVTKVEQDAAQHGPR